MFCVKLADCYGARCVMQLAILLNVASARTISARSVWNHLKHVLVVDNLNVDIAYSCISYDKYVYLGNAIISKFSITY